MTGANDPQTQPESLDWIGNHEAVRISWADGHESLFPVAFLRRICPCAACAGTHESPPLSPKPEGARRLQMLSHAEADEARESVSVVQAWPVGNYGIGLLWADGHRDGIYTFKYLREHCPDETTPPLPENTP